MDSANDTPVGDTDAPELRSLTSVVDRVLDEARSERVAIGNIADAVGHASFAPLLLVPALAVVTPLSGIPGFSSFCGIIIVLIAGQWVIGRDHVWLPQWVMHRNVGGGRLRRALSGIRPWTDWLDRLTRPRLTFLFRRPLKILPPMACVLFGALMPFLELVPLSSSLLGTAVVLLSFSMLTRDGLFALIALLPVLGAGSAVFAIFW